jgi:hypothetical protein
MIAVPDGSIKYKNAVPAALGVPGPALTPTPSKEPSQAEDAPTAHAEADNKQNQKPALAYARTINASHWQTSQ